MYCRRLKIKKLYVCAFIAILLFFSSGCEPMTKVTFQNQRDEDVKLYVAAVHRDGSIGDFGDYGTIQAKTTKTITIAYLGNEHTNRLQIRDSAGKVLFSHDYKRPDLEKIGWKIVIPP
jgi:hypothetical protein